MRYISKVKSEKRKRERKTKYDLTISENAICDDRGARDTQNKVIRIIAHNFSNNLRFTNQSLPLSIQVL